MLAASTSVKVLGQSLFAFADKVEQTQFLTFLYTVPVATNTA